MSSNASPSLPPVDYLTKLSKAVKTERQAHAALLAARRAHAEARRHKDALVNWLADGMTA